FFFQAEDGIRDRNVTGVQTCALPICLVLARDRLGIKPLFYTSGPRGFGFASEIKALVAGRLTQRQVDPGALLHYLSCGYVPGAATIYRDVQRLAPGELLVADRDGVERRPYWVWQ